VQYYAYARSTLVDHDLWLADEYADGASRFRSLVPKLEITIRGFANAYAPVGAAVAWMPAFAATHAWLGLARHTTDGYSEPEMFSTALTSWAFAFLGVLLLYDLALRWFSPRIAALAIVGAWLASPLFSNTFELPMFTHGVDFGIVSVLLYLVFTRGVRADAGEWLFIGAVSGWAVATRQQNVSLAVVPAVYWFRLPCGYGWRSGRWTALAATLTGAVVGFAPQMAMNVSLFGQPLMFQRHYVPHVDWPPHLWRDLFSRQCGLFAWTPLMLPACIGLIAAAAQPGRRTIAGLGMATLALNLLIIGVLPNGPVIIGQRYLINCVPFLALGLGVIFEWMGVDRTRNHAIGAGVLTAIAVLWNLNLDTLVVYNQIDRNVAFTLSELVRKELLVAPRYWTNHLRGLSINQPCFSLASELARGARGDLRALTKGIAAFLAVLSSAAGAVALARALSEPGRNATFRQLTLTTAAATALLLPATVALIWLSLGHVL